MDTGLEAAAQRGGKITKVMSADELNAAALRRGDEPPYLSGTKVYHVKTSGETKFVRVYGGKSDRRGYWIMNADDIKGLTKEQIRGRHSLPPGNTLDDLCDVFVPEGITMEISYTGPAFTWSGGGAQYRFISGYDDPWFMNGRTLP